MNYKKAYLKLKQWAPHIGRRLKRFKEKTICKSGGWDGIVRGEDARRLERAMKYNETHKVPKAEYDRAMAVYNSIGEPKRF